MKKLSIMLLRIGIKLHGITSCVYTKTPSPLTFRIDLKKLYPSMLNSMERNDSSNFASNIISTSIFPLVIAIKWSSLFLMELILMSPMITQFGYFFSKKTQMFRIKFFLIQNFSKSFIIIIDLFNVDINITIKITLAFTKIRLIDVN